MILPYAGLPYKFAALFLEGGTPASHVPYTIMALENHRLEALLVCQTLTSLNSLSEPLVKIIFVRVKVGENTREHRTKAAPSDVTLINQ